ncbi:MAG TPA: 16S rRNA (cytosine(967)-C(5))-methyltransferase RsmB, partial [Lautropia sp.]|nr:16S rRNA (cytosine(967)-C(5))-methyltransferase RsmB [Lautropia sp.]
GKALQLASQGWSVTALDQSARRLQRLGENLARTGLEADIVCADALTWQAEELFDAVLLDAPCTATGTCRRHPDVLHRIGQQDIADRVELQTSLLGRAAGWVKPGGTLIYAVCSLEREEGEEQVGRIALAPWPVEAEELPAGLMPTAEGWARTDPGVLEAEGGLDGFLIARWRKPA